MFRPGGKSTAMASDGKVKVHTTWADGSEQVEEYDQKTEQLLTRKLRKKSSVGGEGPWEFEIGEAPPRPSDVGIVENPDNPVCVRRDTRRQFQWRVRNIAFPVEIYQVTVSPEEHAVTIRTSNKKWYKKLIVPDTQRLGCQVKARPETLVRRSMFQNSNPSQLNPATLQVAHANRTLVVSVDKPDAMISAEETWREQRKKLGLQKDGDVQCPQQ